MTSNMQPLVHMDDDSKTGKTIRKKPRALWQNNMKQQESNYNKSKSVKQKNERPSNDKTKTRKSMSLGLLLGAWDASNITPLKHFKIKNNKRMSSVQRNTTSKKKKGKKFPLTNGDYTESRAPIDNNNMRFSIEPTCSETQTESLLTTSQSSGLVAILDDILQNYDDRQHEKVKNTTTCHRSLIDLNQLQQSPSHIHHHQQQSKLLILEDKESDGSVASSISDIDISNLLRIELSSKTSPKQRIHHDSKSTKLPALLVGSDNLIGLPSGPTKNHVSNIFSNFPGSFDCENEHVDPNHQTNLDRRNGNIDTSSSRVTSFSTNEEDGSINNDKREESVGEEDDISSIDKSQIDNEIMKDVILRLRLKFGINVLQFDGVSNISNDEKDMEDIGGDNTHEDRNNDGNDNGKGADNDNGNKDDNEKS